MLSVVFAQVFLQSDFNYYTLAINYAITVLSFVRILAEDNIYHGDKIHRQR